jgi:hypothetical protein
VRALSFVLRLKTDNEVRIAVVTAGGGVAACLAMLGTYAHCSGFKPFVVRCVSSLVVSLLPTRRLGS